MQFDVLARFQLDAPAVSCDRYGCGHINETYLVVTESGRRYILQKISNRAFPTLQVCRRTSPLLPSSCTPRPPIPTAL